MFKPYTLNHTPGKAVQTVKESLTRKWIFLVETQDEEFCLGESGNEIDRDDALCKCFVGTTIEASRESVRRGLLHEDNNPSFLSRTITYESQGIVG